MLWIWTLTLGVTMAMGFDNIVIQRLKFSANFSNFAVSLISELMSFRLFHGFTFMIFFWEYNASDSLQEKKIEEERTHYWSQAMVI